MVTRYIEANKPSQVNSENIGVQVYPADVPKTVGFKVNYNYITYNVICEANGKNIIIPSQPYANLPFKYTGVNDVIDNVTYMRYVGPDETTYLWAQEGEVQFGTVLYTAEGSGTEQDPYRNATSATDVLIVCETSGTFIIEDGGCYNTTSGYHYIVDFGTYRLTKSYQTGAFDGCVESQESHQDNGVTFNLMSSSLKPGYYTWQCTSYASTYANRYLFTTTDDPSVGDTAYWSTSDLSFLPQIITELVTVPEPGQVNCEVSYSVTGNGWTTHPTVLTDENNVICHIPRYMYLKFSQDVEITEE